MPGLSIKPKSVTATIPRDVDLTWDSSRKTHPCFYQKAHLNYARMHLAVAPACNIQCNYCDRNFDCPNESRPGAASECITPEEALLYVKAAQKTVPTLSVVGIAGPGDPLANTRQTFTTFALIRQAFPDLKLCLSTNGLNLLTCLEEIAAFNIKYITITINAIDPAIGKSIYAWVNYRGVRYLGEEAAALLWSQQQKGLQALVDCGILVKINTVLIPGVNDHHVYDIAGRVKELGAEILNIVPLIPLPGTAFAHLSRPSAVECNQLRTKCESVIRVMRHCRQCRADAVGLLGNDMSAEFTREKVKAHLAEDCQLDDVKNYFKRG